MTNESTNEPVAWVCESFWVGEKNNIDFDQEEIDALPVGTMLYVHPQDQKKDEALRLALEALKRTGNIKGPAHDREQIAITLIEQALENK